LIPYTRLLQRGFVDGIMSAHIVNARLDPDSLPGTLSVKMIDNLLRKGLGYSGVVFSDDMQMQAITNEFGLEEAIRMAITAGVDILCFSNNIQGSQERTVAKVHGIIRTFVNEGVISADRIDQSYRRIMQLKTRLGTSEADYYHAQLVKAEEDAAKQRMLAEANMQLARENEQKARQQMEQLKKEQTTGKKKKKKS
jgi:beta-N-acetylhexosaminidase